MSDSKTLRDRFYHMILLMNVMTGKLVAWGRQLREAESVEDISSAQRTTTFAWESRARMASSCHDVHRVLVEKRYLSLR